ncbi:Cna B-type domain-containing protein [Streptococcus sp. X16XC17]|uniref:Cna B-type domain-containing protein n=1 Tax=unclassified Streptococcus TaxID=2608887 RepID=UPI00066FEAAB|nr:MULTISPECIES: Cna B-type domain-containing protein [unclassified Streptococcus]TCD46380.1 Cna B-type domain-containing protein [Streptococcus sp. X16XC17]
MPEGDYIFQEDAAPVGCLKADPIEFHFSADGQVTIQGVVVPNSVVEMKDKSAPYISIKINKNWVDKNDQPVPDAEKSFLVARLQLKANGADAKDLSGNQWSGEFTNLPTTDKDGGKINYTFVEDGDPRYSLKDNPIVTVDRETPNQEVKEVTLTNKEINAELAKITAQK